MPSPQAASKASAEEAPQQGQQPPPPQRRRELYECCIVGGGPAGLSAALILGRSRRSVLLFDSGDKRNEVSEVQHAILGADGERRAEFLARARAQVLAYPSVDFYALPVVDVDIGAARVRLAREVDPADRELTNATLRSGEQITETARFKIYTEDGREWRAKKLILATGVRDELPDIPGFADFWGHGIGVCLYCDAWEYSDKRLGAYGNGPRGVHMALEMLLWSGDVTLFTGGARLAATPLERALLARRGVPVEEGALAEAYGGPGGELAGVRLAGGRRVPLDALFFNTGRGQNSHLPTKLGLPSDDRGDIVCEMKGNVQAVHGLYVAGNCATAPLKLVITAASQGAVTGARVNSELLYEDLGMGRDGEAREAEGQPVGELDPERQLSAQPGQLDGEAAWGQEGGGAGGDGGPGEDGAGGGPRSGQGRS